MKPIATMNVHRAQRSPLKNASAEDYPKKLNASNQHGAVKNFVAKSFHVKSTIAKKNVMEVRNFSKKIIEI